MVVGVEGVVWVHCREGHASANHLVLCFEFLLAVQQTRRRAALLPRPGHTGRGLPGFVVAVDRLDVLSEFVAQLLVRDDSRPERSERYHLALGGAQPRDEGTGPDGELGFRHELDGAIL